MRKPGNGSTPRTNQGRSSVLTLAVTVGLMIFFVAGESEGGLTGPQGFLVGSSSILVLFILMSLLEALRRTTGPELEEQQFDQLLGTRPDGEDGASIQLKLDRELVHRKWSSSDSASTTWT